MSKSRRRGTISNNKSTWERFATWCGQIRVDTFCCCIEYVVNLLAELFENGLEYIVIGPGRSAILTFHQKFNDVPWESTQLFLHYC